MSSLYLSLFTGLRKSKLVPELRWPLEVVQASETQQEQTDNAPRRGIFWHALVEKSRLIAGEMPKANQAEDL